MSKKTVRVQQKRCNENFSKTIEYLQKLRPGGPWTFGAIAPDDDGNTFTLTTKDLNAAREFLDALNDGRRELVAGTFDIMVPVYSDQMMH